MALANLALRSMVELLDVSLQKIVPVDSNVVVMVAVPVGKVVVLSLPRGEVVVISTPVGEVVVLVAQVPGSVVVDPVWGTDVDTGFVVVQLMLGPAPLPVPGGVSTDANSLLEVVAVEYVNKVPLVEVVLPVAEAPELEIVEFVVPTEVPVASCGCSRRLKLSEVEDVVDVAVESSDSLDTVSPLHLFITRSIYSHLHDFD